MKTITPAASFKQLAAQRTAQRLANEEKGKAFVGVVLKEINDELDSFLAGTRKSEYLKIQTTEVDTVVSIYLSWPEGHIVPINGVLGSAFTKACEALGLAEVESMLQKAFTESGWESTFDPDPQDPNKVAMIQLIANF